MNNEKEIAELKEKLRQLNAKRYKRFNVMIFNDNFEKLSKEAERKGTSKAKMLGEMIKKFNK